MPSGSVFESTTATIGMPRRLASCTAICSLLVSMMKRRSGTPPMSLMPPMARSSLSRLRVIVSRSFLVRALASELFSSSSSFLSWAIEPLIVFQLVSMPPSQRALTKYCAERLAASAIGSCACRFVPTKSTRPPAATTSDTACSARLRSGTVCVRSRMCTLLRTPKMKGFIFGFQRCFWWPKCTPLSRSWRMENSGIAMDRVSSLPVVPLREGSAFA